MQDYTKTNRLSLKTFLFFAAVLIIAYLPISSFLFFLKNDAFNGYFPPKFFMSESIHAGYLPLWNPYINFGFPQYGDMSGGYWSPITWLLASTIGYNAFTLTIETLFYILLSGLGMYKLTGYWNLQNSVRIMAGLAFMCCGYHVGHLQHFNWLSGSAFFVWSFWAYVQMLQKPTLKTIVLAVLLFYMLFSSAHPGISIAAFYFFIVVFLFHVFSRRGSAARIKTLKTLSISHLLFVGLLLLLSAGMLLGYADILPHFIRSEKVSLNYAPVNASGFSTWVSVLLPMATVKNDALFLSDISMRNHYFSLLFLIFFILALTRKMNSWQKLLLITGVFFALVSAEGPFKTFVYKYIPLFGYVRLNGEFILFATFSFILVSAIQLDQFLKEERKNLDTITWVLHALRVLLIGLIGWALFKIFSTRESFLFQLSELSQHSGLAAKLKFILDSIRFYDCLWMQGILQFILLTVMHRGLKFHPFNLLKRILILDLVLASLLNIPFTGAGKASLFKVQQVLNKSPKGIPIPGMQPIRNQDTLSADEKDLLGSWTMYSKQIGTLKEIVYPIQLYNMKAFFNQSDEGLAYFDKPFIFQRKESAGDTIELKAFNPQKINLRVVSETADEVVLQQNYYPNWYYKWGAEKKPMEKMGINFMKFPVPAGATEVTIEFHSGKIKAALLFSGVMFLILVIFMIIPRFRNTKLFFPSSPPQ